MSITIRRLRAEDLGPVAKLHRESFPSFFLSELGERFLREFYRGFLTPDATTAVAVAEDGRVVGAVVGHTQPQGFFKKLLLRRWYAFAFASLSLVLRRPSILPRLVRAVTYRGNNDGIERRGALLSSICVDPQYSGDGIRGKLLESFTSQLVDRGCESAYLSTDAVDNDRVNAFYRNAGWALENPYTTPEGRRMNCYVWHKGQTLIKDSDR